MYLCKARDVQAFSMLHGGFAGFSRPRPFALAFGKAGPGKDVVVGQVQVCGVDCELADELQQAGEAVQLPLQAKRVDIMRKTRSQRKQVQLIYTETSEINTSFKRISEPIAPDFFFEPLVLNLFVQLVNTIQISSFQLIFFFIIRK